MTEEPRDGAGLAQLLDGWRIRDQGPERGAAARDPFGHRHGEALLPGESRRYRHLLADPAPQQPFAQPMLDLELVGQAKGEVREHRVEQGRAPLDAVRHEAAVELAQRIVRQRARDIYA